MRFTKMHGIGNDYVYVSTFDQAPPADPAGLAIAVSDRHFGVGSDGLILICPPSGPTPGCGCSTPTGPESEMCGNGVRCVAKYIHDHGIARKDRVTIETGRGVLTLDLEVEGGKARRVRVDMGAPILQGSDIPTLLPGDPPVDVPLRVADREFARDGRLDGQPARRGLRRRRRGFPVETLGPVLEHHPAFPRRVNAHFVKVLDPAKSGCGPGSAGRESPWPAAPAPAPSASPACSPAEPGGSSSPTSPAATSSWNGPATGPGLHDRPGHRGLLGRMARLTVPDRTVLQGCDRSCPSPSPPGSLA